MQKILSIMGPVLKSIELSYERRGASLGLSTSFNTLDALTNGLQPGHLIVIASVPSMGKTTFALNIVDWVAVVGKNETVVFSLGTPAEQVVRRLLCARSKIDLQKIKEGLLSERDFPNLAVAASKLVESPIFIDDTLNLSVEELKERVKAAKAENDLKLVVVDDLHRLSASNQRVWHSREGEVTEVAKGLKAMAMEFGVPVLALSKLTAKERQDEIWRPVLSESHEGEGIEEYADIAGLLERSEYDAENEEAREALSGKATLQIVKNEYGPVAEIKLTFARERLRFEVDK